MFAQMTSFGATSMYLWVIIKGCRDFGIQKVNMFARTYLVISNTLR